MIGDAGRRFARALLLLGSLAGFGSGPVGAEPLPPSPQALLGLALLRTPPMDSVPACGGAHLEPAARRLLALASEEPVRIGTELASVEPEAGRDLLFGVVRARLARDVPSRLRARALLEVALTGPGSAALRACAQYELARLELLLGRHSEAVAWASLATATHPRVRSGRRFFEAVALTGADALYLAGWRERAYEAFQQLVRSENPRVSGAARLRIVDVKFDAGRVAEALPAYTALLARPEQIGASLGGWGARVVEAALAAGDLKTARGWLERLVGDPSSEASAPLFTLRLADVLAAQGEIEQARRLLRGIESGHGGTPPGDLATARLLALPRERDGAPAPEDIRTLEAVVRRVTPPLSFYARTVLGEQQLVLGRSDEALAMLVDAAFQAAGSAVSPYAEAALDRALESTTRDDDCRVVIRRVGGSRGYLVRTARFPEPSLRIGACYESMGLPGVALEVYRGLTRQFGSKVAEAVSLPVARSSFGIGRRTAARHAAEARIARGGADPEWSRLLARIQLADGDAAAAAETWAQLVREEDSAARRLEAATQLARSALAARPDDASRQLLFETLSRAEALAAVDAEAYVRALLLAGRLHRRDGDMERAHALYELAAAHGPSDAVAYWLGRLDGDAERARAAFERATKEGDGPYARLAAHRIGLGRIRTALGMGYEPARRP